MGFYLLVVILIACFKPSLCFLSLFPYYLLEYVALCTPKGAFQIWADKAGSSVEASFFRNAAGALAIQEGSVIGEIYWIRDCCRK